MEEKKEKKKEEKTHCAYQESRSHSIYSFTGLFLTVTPLLYLTVHKPLLTVTLPLNVIIHKLLFTCYTPTVFNHS